MIGEKATDLIKDLVKNSNDILPKYCDDLVGEIINEMNHLYEQNRLDIQNKGDNSSQMFTVIQVRHEALLWNKRCLVNYHHERLMKLKMIRWQYGSVLPADIRQNLSESEIKWFSSYCNNLAEYMQRLNDGNGLDLMLHIKAPKRLYIQVRCLIEYGDFDLDDGTFIHLSKHSIHYLPTSQCEKLIHQGVLEQILE